MGNYPKYKLDAHYNDSTFSYLFGLTVVSRDSFQFQRDVPNLGYNW